MHRGQNSRALYYQRGVARAQLGHLADSLADANHALEAARGVVDANFLGRLEGFAAVQYSFAGDPKGALKIYQDQMRDTNVKGARGFLFGAYRQVGGILIKMGDLPQAETYLHRSLALIQEARTSGLPGWRTSYSVRGQSWEAEVEYHRALVFEAHGQYAAAEKSYQLAEARRRASIKPLLSSPNPPTESQLLQSADLLVVAQSRMKAKQGRLAEAEADARRALLARLKDQGKYNAVTSFYITGLANTLVEQGRYAEAEKLARVALDITRAVGVAEDAQSTVSQLAFLGSILSVQHKRKEAIETYRELDKAMANWEPQRRQLFDLSGSRIYALYASGQVDRGIAAAETLLKRNTTRLGEKSYETALARGTLAVGYMRGKRDADAAREFRTAIPLLMNSGHDTSDDDNATAVAARNERLQNVVESYIALLDRGQTGNGDDSVAAETFSLADAIRGQSVQLALAQSSARMQIQDSKLAELVREEQDLNKQMNAQLGSLNNALTLPSEQRDENGIKALNVAIAKLRGGRDKLRVDIAKLFPSYAGLDRPESALGRRHQGNAEAAMRRFCRFISAATATSSGRFPRPARSHSPSIPASYGDIELENRHAT